MSFVADAEGVGTTMVVAPDLDGFRPAFGPGSRERHLEAGAVEIDVDVPTLRRDVDEPTDLDEAIALGVGSRTAMVTTLLRLG
jgi:2-phospho-L-lactate guanylyltransferase